jgi:hypothetical protein
MKTKLVAGAAGTSLLLASLIATATPAMAAAPPKVTIAVSGDQATVSQSQMRPGIVEFTIGKTFTIPPGDDGSGGPEQLSVMRTDQLDLVLAQFADVFGDPSDPAAGAKSAAAMRTIRENSTWYGGGFKGTTYQVNLPAGTYYVLGTQSTPLGLVKPATFTVSGERRKGSLHKTSATIRAVELPGGGNGWANRGLGSLGNGWLKFANSSKEIHFLSMSGVKPKTTLAQVQKAFQSEGPPKIFTGTEYGLEVISPGVTIAVKGPFEAGRYLLSCFVPSEVDGMPHAFMGMLKLVNVD